MADDLYAVRAKYAERKRGPQGQRKESGGFRALDALGAPQIAFKESVGDFTGAGRGEWFPKGDLPTWAYAGGNAALDVFADPLNLLGVGLFSKGTKAANALTGASSGKGMLPSSPSNYIPNYYGPTDIPEGAPTMFENLLTNTNIGPLKKIDSPQIAREALAKPKSMAQWAGESAQRTIKQAIDPKARALYRETGVNINTQDDIRRLLEGEKRGRTKATAQVQQNSLVRDQAGRKGNVDLSMSEIEKRSYLTPSSNIKDKNYSDLIKDNKLTGTLVSESGKITDVPVRDKDLTIIQEHIENVWKSRGVKAKDSEGTFMRIKAPYGKETGMHGLDFRQKSKFMPSLEKFFGGKDKTIDEIYKFASENPNITLHSKSETLEKAKENGIWVTGSFKGTAVTEGGVNYIAKINTDGKVMAVVSDENNFLENLPVVGKIITEALPNRAISATPPMFFDVTKRAKVSAPKAAGNEESYDKVLRDVASLKPSNRMVRAEQQRNVGGMLTGASLQTDENN